ncbi:hypothetical protein D3C73_1397980 [compost metagenome]
MQLDFPKHPVFLQLGTDQTDRQRTAVNRNGQLAEHKRKRTDVVLMPVSQKQTLDFVLVLDQVGNVRDNIIDTGQFGVREFQSCVNNYNLVLVFDAVHVLADFADSAEGIDPYRGRRRLRAPVRLCRSYWFGICFIHYAVNPL